MQKKTFHSTFFLDALQKKPMILADSMKMKNNVAAAATSEEADEAMGRTVIFPASLFKLFVAHELAAAAPAPTITRGLHFSDEKPNVGG